MTTAGQAWIQDSLARLETLESEKARFEAYGQAAPTELEEEIQTLYETLQAVADDDEAANQDPAASAWPSAGADAPAAASLGAAPMTPDSASPFAPPAMMMAAPAAPPAGYGEINMPRMEPQGSSFGDYFYDDVDIRPPGSKAPWVLLGLVLLVGGGVGGWMILDQQAAAKPEVQPAGAALVIEAGKIPNDTQEPDVAEGAEADRTEGTRYKESPNHRSARPSARSGPRSAPRHRAKASDGREIKLTKENDPLSGVK